MVNLTIDGKQISVEENTTIMEAARINGIPIPKLCYLKGINEIAACRVCVVELEGKERLITSSRRIRLFLPRRLCILRRISRHWRHNCLPRSRHWLSRHWRCLISGVHRNYLYSFCIDHSGITEDVMKSSFFPVNTGNNIPYPHRKAAP